MSYTVRRVGRTQLIEKLECRRLLSSSSTIVVESTLEVESSVTNSTVQGYTPSEIKSAYGISGIKGDGSGQTIAIVDAYNDPNIASDLKKFDNTFGLNSASLKVVNQSGGSSLPATDAGWSAEISLDVEWAHAIAPGAKILLVEAKSSSLTDLLAAVNYARNASGVSVVSMSWGATEFSSETSYDSYFTTPSGHQGVTFVASSGDDAGYYGALWPSISSNVLSVGGTTLNLTSSGSYSSETAWSDSTGGISRYESETSYQQIAQTTGRETSPDVSYDANPSTGFAVYDSVTYDGQSGWFELGGTSAGAPQWAALIAIANQQRVAKGKSTLGGVTGTLSTLYSLYTSSAYSNDYHDITSGNNGVWVATSGYDAVTGLGSPKAAQIVAALVSASSNTSSAAPAVTSSTAAHYAMSSIRHTVPTSTEQAASAGVDTGELSVSSYGKGYAAGGSSNAQQRLDTEMSSEKKPPAPASAGSVKQSSGNSKNDISSSFAYFASGDVPSGRELASDRLAADRWVLLIGTAIIISTYHIPVRRRISKQYKKSGSSRLAFGEVIIRPGTISS